MSERKPLPSPPPQSPSPREAPILEPGVDPGAHARQVHRRHVAGFLAGLSMAMPLAAGFSWLSRGSRAACPSASPAPEPVASPAPAARPAPTLPALRPRLLIVLPENADLHYDLGHALGEYLNHADDAALAPLAAVDLACMAASEIDLPAQATGQGALALLLIAGDTQRLVRFALPTMDGLGYGEDALIERRIDQRIAVVSSAVRRAVLDQDRVVGLSPRMLAHKRVQEIATRARAGYPIADWRTHSGYGHIRALDEMANEANPSSEPMAPPLMPDEAAHFAPALLSVALGVTGEARKSLLGTLAAVVRRRVVEGEVTGAEWATSGGCGLTFDKRESNIGVLCGMGHVPARSRRFLHFYTQKLDG